MDQKEENTKEEKKTEVNPAEEGKADDKKQDEKAEKPSFKSKRIKRTYTQKINSTPEKIFPLLCPQRELDWLDGWNYEMVFSQTGLAEDGAVFKTKHDGDVDTIWVVSKYDPENFSIEFIRMTWEVVVTNISLSIKTVTPESSELNVEYTFTSITEKGNEFIEGRSARQFLDMMKWWEKSLNYYLETGNKLLALKL